MTKPAPYSEALLQACVIRALNAAERAGHPVIAEGDMNAAKRGTKAAAEAKMTGLRPGAADVRVFLPEGRIAMFELKTAKGRVSKEQEAHHEILRSLGHPVQIVRAEHPRDAAKRVMSAVANKLRADQGEFRKFANDATDEILTALGRE